jgi:S1-C subfamily serine protease
MHKFISAIRILVLTVLIINSHSSLGKVYDISPNIIDKTKSAVVNIEVSSSIKAYGFVHTSSFGTGFIVDKKQGIILTNRHIADHTTVSSFKLIFYNGETLPGKLLYADPWLDFAFIKVDPSLLPDGVNELHFSKQATKLGQEVFVIGNNERNRFSMQAGTISDVSSIKGSMPQHSIIVSLNTKPGSSGSPILNRNGDVVALNYGSNSTFAIGLHARYIEYALSFIKKSTIPVRKHIGAIISHYSLSDAIEYRYFSQEKLKEYIKKFPNSMTNVLQVLYTMQGSPAQSNIRAGDIIWAVDGLIIGPDLSILDMAMNSTKKDFVTLTVFRNGEWLTLDVPLYNLENHKLKKIVQFAGALFFEVDDLFSDKTGIAPKRVTFCNSVPNSTFSKVKCYPNNNGANYLCDMLLLDNESISNLDQLIKIIQKLRSKKTFTIDYSLVCPIFENDSELFGMRFSQADLYKADVEYEESYTEPRIFTFDPELMVWKSDPIT